MTAPDQYPQEADRLIDQEIEQAEARLTVREAEDRMHAFLSAKLGFTVSATTLYSAVYGEAYDGSDPQASRNRNYLQHMFNANHSFGKRYIARCKADGKAIQSGTMFIDRDDPEAKPKEKRVYRMHDAAIYTADRGEAFDLRDGFYIKWNPAAITVDVNPREVPEHITVDSIKDKQTTARQDAPRRTRTVRKAVVEAEIDKPGKAPETPPSWMPTFMGAVREAIAKVEEDSLMVPGHISASTIKRQTKGAVLGTDTNLSRMYAANLINRAQLKQQAPLSAETVVIAALFNSNKHILGKKSKMQKQAVAAARSEVENYFKNAKDQTA